MPTDMTAEGRREWKKIVPLLLGLSVLSVIDGAALEGYCEAYSESRQAARIIRKEGLTVESSKGDTRPHPAVGIRDKAQKRMKSFLVEFGLTPASRTRIHAVPKDEVDRADKYFDRQPAPGSGRSLLN